jgi:hypothetical protein
MPVVLELKGAADPHDTGAYDGKLAMLRFIGHEFL